MASSLRCLSTARHLTRIFQTRLLSTTLPVRSESAPNIGTLPPQNKPVGGFRGRCIVGFLFGFSLASSFAAYHLLEEYREASAALQASVETLENSTEKICAHVRRIEGVEKDLKGLAQASASKENLSKVREETKKLIDGLHIEILDLRSHIWGMQQDLQSLSKKDSTTVRI